MSQSILSSTALQLGTGTLDIASEPSVNKGSIATPVQANQEDVHAFQASISESVTPASRAIAPTASAASHPLGHLASLEAEAMSKLQQLSTSMNPGDYMKTARAVSAYQLETMVATKVIAKSTQAIEKLTNLQ